MVTMLWRAAGQPVAGGAASFTDVSADSYYAQAVKNLEGAASEADSHEINTNVRLRCPVCGIKVDGQNLPAVR